ncbi:hypothetical protein [Lacipirellula parvula]|uniref:Uncharacterized protein n=1 Tax=Lacipirellula parvula TaxID=2650471 RepID=A0A5K7X5L4_9BACT|nr:hypothetical protein [Lacipirellula parvula]BBO31830.1 hypothetical protein PLANPX_1442 [Lacipirellula parvula]
MARDARDREDLLRDARGLSPRVELVVGQGSEAFTFFAGFRGESLSLYFGHDRVYHFNDRGELRRAYLDDVLLKAEQGRLVAMSRERSASEVSLVSRELSVVEARMLLHELKDWLRALSEALAAGAYELVGEEPLGSGVIERLVGWLRAGGDEIQIATSPRVS